MSQRMDLVGLTEIAQRAGVQKAAVSMWRARHEDFPEPVAELRTGAVWLWADMAAWLIETGRRIDANWSLEQVSQDRRGPRVIGT